MIQSNDSRIKTLAYAGRDGRSDPVLQRLRLRRAGGELRRRIKEGLGCEVELERGRRGQFDVLVGERTVVSRKGGLFAKLLGKPWPEEEAVVAAVRAAVEQSSTQR